MDVGIKKTLKMKYTKQLTVSGLSNKYRWHSSVQSVKGKWKPEVLYL